jgi:transcriptional regulator with GAF, ATPase, and Fis domain
MSDTRPPPPPDGDDSEVDSWRSEPLELLVSCQSGAHTIALGPGESHVIGRDPTADLVIQDESVSRRHAIVHRGQPPMLEDLGSTNGTVAMGTRLSNGQVPFPIGSVAQVGLATIVLQRRRRAAPVVPLTTIRPPVNAEQAPGPVVVDEAMQGLYGVLTSIAPTVLPVLILGETGTGKEVFAEAVHSRSPRRNRPFLKLNCGALPESTLESELFGHERGAFTGAIQAKQGLFEAADTGSLFLDEIGEMPRATQVKLLRVLESGEVLRLGSVKPRRVDVRLISATNRDLNQLVAAGEFRMDLLFRVNGFTFLLPPLRERPSEIAPLARLFAARAAARTGIRTPDFTAQAMEALKSGSWPGNIRELRNVVDRAVALCPLHQPAIGVEHLLLPTTRVSMPPSSPMPIAEPVFAPPAPTPRQLPRIDSFEPVEVTSVMSPVLRESVQFFERERIQEALDRCEGHQGKAAKLLGISRRTLFNKMELYQIKRGRRTQQE